MGSAGKDRRWAKTRINENKYEDSAESLIIENTSMSRSDRNLNDKVRLA